MNLRSMFRNFLHLLVYRVLAIEVLNIPFRHFRKLIVPILPTRLKAYRIIRRFPVVGRVSVKLPNSRRLILYTKGDDYIAERIFYGGILGFEKQTILLFLELLRYSEVFIDIGANIGIYSLIAAIENRQRSIYSFEPVPVVLNHFVRNIRLNKIRNISVESVAVGDYDGKTILYIPRSNEVPASASTLKGFRETSDEIIIPITKLDTFCRRKNIKPDLIKIDTEATEHCVISGAIEIMRKYEPSIICEVLKDRTEKYLNELLIYSNYRYFWISDNGLIPKDQIEGNSASGNMNYLFVSEARMKTLPRKLLSMGRTTVFS